MISNRKLEKWFLELREKVWDIDINASDICKLVDFMAVYVDGHNIRRDS